MARFQVPQFIEVEDKIFGPLTLKQFIYVGGGAGLSFVLWKVLPTFIAMPIIGGVGGLAIALAFYKVNNRPFIVMLESAFMYITRSRLYLWQASKPKKKKKNTKRNMVSAVEVPNLSDHKLKNLAWSLDINERITKDVQAGDMAEINYGK